MHRIRPEETFTVVFSIVKSLRTLSQERSRSKQPRYLEQNKSSALRLHRHCGGECLRDWTIVPPTTMQSRAPIDVSCEAAKDITFSCLRYLAATIIRWVRAYVAARTYYSQFVRKNMLARQARPYSPCWYGFYEHRTIHGKGVTCVYAPSQNFTLV